MKPINLRLPDDEYLAIAEAAKAESLPMTTLLRRVFREYNAARLESLNRAKVLAPQSLRAQALERYRDLVARAPAVDTVTPTECKAFFDEIVALRAETGLSPKDTPLPRQLLDHQTHMIASRDKAWVKEFTVYRPLPSEQHSPPPPAPLAGPVKVDRQGRLVPAVTDLTRPDGIYLEDLDGLDFNDL